MQDHPGVKRIGLAVVSPGVKKIATLRSLLHDYELRFARRSPPVGSQWVLAWGRRPSALRAIRSASKSNLPVLTIEDGFLRSVGLGVDDPPLSIVVDDIGVYYDASAPSRLEFLIKSPLDAEQTLRALRLQQLWCELAVSKYNSGNVDFVSPAAPYVVVVDQTLGDISVSAGLAGVQQFHQMLDAALTENPASQIVLKVHPEVVAGRKRGHFDLAAVARMSRVTILAEDVHMPDVLREAQAVYVVTSQVGFEGLLWGKPVRTFGMPFYAGWGLTTDELPPCSRRRTVSLEQLIHGALIEYARYVDPETDEPCDPERVVEWLGLQRQFGRRYTGPHVAFGFSRWKEPFVRDFIGARPLRFTADVGDAITTSPSERVVAWGCKHDDVLGKLDDDTKRRPLLRIEDGFLRSVGLGADLIRPLSWVLDDTGIYYDARRPSALESTLRHHLFTAAERERARNLRERINSSRITKYNLAASGSWIRPAQAGHVILVPGQVESDASIRFGNGGITRNIDLLAAIRSDNPDAYILYKPHPDVLAGLRQRGNAEETALDFCDEIISNVSLTDLFEQVDGVHVLTSLAGFEALMRGIPVVTYGQPFYSGWGLTVDKRMSKGVLARRQRLLDLDELVYGVLVLYPTYVSRHTRRFTTPERILDELEAWRLQSPVVPRWRRMLSRMFKKK
ncbi:capsular polysaccharide biosynthesis protein [Alcaligenaceae bacterium A4P071]|nr:capsular polysaccharide biosynthesis protein [Alcaligenaceae bacterium A4P071]